MIESTRPMQTDPHHQSDHYVGDHDTLHFVSGPMDQQHTEAYITSGDVSCVYNSAPRSSLNEGQWTRPPLTSSVSTAWQAYQEAMYSRPQGPESLSDNSVPLLAQMSSGASDSHIWSTAQSISPFSWEPSPAQSTEDYFSGSQDQSSLDKEYTSGHQSSTKPVPLPTRAKRSRIPHNVIERRYRHNINNHIEALALRIPEICERFVSRETCIDMKCDPASSNFPIRAPSKADVLAATVRYIDQLEKRRRDLEEQVVELQRTAHFPERPNSKACRRSPSRVIEDC